MTNESKISQGAHGGGGAGAPSRYVHMGGGGGGSFHGGGAGGYGKGGAGGMLMTGNPEVMAATLDLLTDMGVKFTESEWNMTFPDLSGPGPWGGGGGAIKLELREQLMAAHQAAIKGWRR